MPSAVSLHSLIMEVTRAGNLKLNVTQTDNNKVSVNRTDNLTVDINHPDSPTVDVSYPGSPTVDVNHNHMGVKRHRTSSSSSSNPLDNEILKRHSPGLSAFSDYVDLVKRHLMYAVREEVEILKQQIGEMMERIGQLEYENTVLRSEAKPETLNKLQQARVTQTSQTSLPIQNASTGISPNPQQTSSQQVSSQVQPSQQTMQPPS